MCFESELIAGGDADVARLAIDDRSVDIGVVGFIEQVIEVTLHREIFRHLIASE